MQEKKNGPITRDQSLVKIGFLTGKANIGFLTGKNKELLVC